MLTTLSPAWVLVWNSLVDGHGWTQSAVYGDLVEAQCCLCSCMYACMIHVYAYSKYFVMLYIFRSHILWLHITTIGSRTYTLNVCVYILIIIYINTCNPNIIHTTAVTATIKWDGSSYHWIYHMMTGGKNIDQLFYGHFRNLNSRYIPFVRSM